MCVGMCVQGSDFDIQHTSKFPGKATTGHKQQNNQNLFRDMVIWNGFETSQGTMRISWEQKS